MKFINSFMLFFSVVKKFYSFSFYIWCEVWIQGFCFVLFSPPVTNSCKSFYCSFSTAFPLGLCQKSVVHVYVDFPLYSIFCCIDLFVFMPMSQTWLLKLYNNSWNQVVNPSTLFFSELFWLVWVIFVSIWVLESVCQFLQNILISLWLRLLWIYRSTQGELTL